MNSSIKPLSFCFLMAMVILFTGTGCCCLSKASFGAGRMEKVGNGDVIVCPDEPVYLWWSTEHVQETSIDQGVGPVMPPDQGAKRIQAPDATTTYTLTATGRGEDECTVEPKPSVRVLVVTEGFEYTLVLNNAQKGSFVWTAEMSPAFVSPSIVITSARLHPDTAASWGTWHLQKINPDGSPIGIQLTAERTGVPSSTPLLGRYNLTPVGSSSSAIDTGNPVSIILSLKCKQ